MNRLIILITGMVIVLSSTIYGQQPFEKYGYTVKKVLTLSQGKYEEFFDQDTLVQIGSIIMNRLNGEILSFVEYDTMYSEATLAPEIISRWLSPDPLSHKYYSISPYTYVANNPILFIDPNGAEIEIYSVDGGADYAYVQGKAYTGNDTFIASTVKALNYLSQNSELAQTLIGGLSTSDDFLVSIVKTDGKMNTKGGSSAVTVLFDNASGLIVENSEMDTGVISPAVTLVHELGHAEEINKDVNKANQEEATPDSQYENKSERTVVTNVENPIVKELNKNTNQNEGNRDNHGGTKTPVKCSTCNYEN